MKVTPKVASAPVKKVYRAKHLACPARFVMAFSPEEAQARYRDTYSLHESREVVVEELGDANPE